MEIFGCDVTTGLSLSLYNVVHVTYSLYENINFQYFLFLPQW